MNSWRHKPNPEVFVTACWRSIMHSIPNVRMILSSTSPKLAISNDPEAEAEASRDRTFPSLNNYTMSWQWHTVPVVYWFGHIHTGSGKYSSQPTRIKPSRAVDLLSTRAPYDRTGAIATATAHQTKWPRLTSRYRTHGLCWLWHDDEHDDQIFHGNGRACFRRKSCYAALSD